MNDRVALFARAPSPGRVKNRLAAVIGEDDALACYASLLAGAIAVVSSFEAEVWLEGEDPDMQWAGDLPVRTQPSGDLGAKMLAAFESGAAVVVGSDIPELQPRHISHALELLSDHDLVLGPTEDGGYYLIAMREPHRHLFVDMPWSTDGVLAETVARAESLRIGYCEKLWDVDVEADYRRWLEMLD